MGHLEVELLLILWFLVWLGLLLLLFLGGSSNDGLNSWLGGLSHLVLNSYNHHVEVLHSCLSACLPGEWGVWVDSGVSKAESGPLVNFSLDLSSLPDVLLGGLVLEKSDTGWGSVSSGLELEGKCKVSLMEQSHGLASGVIGPSLLLVFGVEGSGDNWLLVRQSSDSLHVSDGVLWS